jgi:hypothetical protein
MIYEFKVGVDITHIYTWRTFFRSAQIVEQFVLGQVAPEQHLVADCKYVDMSFLRDPECILEFEFVVLPIIVEPDADHGLETLFLRNGRNEFMAVGAGEGANPPSVWLDNCECHEFCPRESCEQVRANRRSTGLKYRFPQVITCACSGLTLKFLAELITKQSACAKSGCYFPNPTAALEQVGADIIG